MMRNENTPIKSPLKFIEECVESRVSNAYSR